LKLSRRDTVAVLGLVWLANQTIGYLYLGYPWTWDSAAWGIAIGASTAGAALVAAGLSTARPVPLAVSLPFVAAFSTYELALYAAGFVLPGSEGAFAAPIVGHILLINALTLGGMVAAYQLAMLLGLLARHDAAHRVVGAASFR
jgi:hypothetical protein